MPAHALTSRSRHLASLALLGILTAACADDGNDSAAADEDTTRFCAAVVETYSTMNRTFAGVDFETTTEEEFGEILTELAATVSPLYEEVAATAPDRIEDAVERRLQVGRRAIETGEEDLSPEAREAERVVDEFVLSECDVASRDVAMTEYAFSGLDEELDAGVTAFVLRNDGAEDHEIGVYLVPDGTSLSPEELFADGAPRLERVGGSELPPGEGVATFMDLEPGRYVVACLLPVDPSDDESPSHAAEGMLTELVVG